MRRGVIALPDLGKVAIDDVDEIIGIECGNQVIAGSFDCMHMAWSDVTGGADESEVFHSLYYLELKIRKSIASNTFQPHSAY